MKRFGLSIIAALLALPVAGGLLATVAAQATPQPMSGIPPIEWQWISFEDPMKGPQEIADPGHYTIQFLPDGVVAMLADCNRAVSDYSIDGASLEIGVIATTMMLCPEGSMDTEFLAAVDNVTSYTINQDQASDTLVLALMADGGLMRFAPALTGVVWEWEMFQGGDESTLAPADPARYTLEFLPDGTVVGQIDCNRGAGQYTTDGANGIAITMATTRIMCPPGSLDAEFGKYISEATSYVIRDGKLALTLPLDSGIMLFNPVVPTMTEATPEANG